MTKTYYKKGTWNAICDICGFEYKADEMRKNWKGLYVCKKDFETRHPQDYLRARPEHPGVPWARPEAEDIEILTTCDYWSSSPLADFGTADCMVVGGNTDINRLIEIYGASSVANIAITGRAISGVL